MYNIKIHFGKLLSSLRHEKGVSQAEVAYNCGFERAYISRLERGLSEPSLLTLFSICDYFKIEPGDMVTTLNNQRKRKKR